MENLTQDQEKMLEELRRIAEGVLEDRSRLDILTGILVHLIETGDTIEVEMSMLRKYEGKVLRIAERKGVVTLTVISEQQMYQENSETLMKSHSKLN